MTGRAGTAWRGRLVAIAAALALLCAPPPATPQPAPPELTAPVNDFAGVVDAESARALDELIRALQAASGDTVVVATVKTFQPWGDVRSYATRMFENGGRGIGEKGKDNGLLVLLAVDDRQVWVEVGYDLEGAVTDGFAGETSRQVMAPYFRQGEYGQGLLAGTSRIVERIAADRNVTVTGVRVPEPPEGDPRSGVARLDHGAVPRACSWCCRSSTGAAGGDAAAGGAVSARGAAGTMGAPGAADRRGAAAPRAGSAGSAAAGAAVAAAAPRGEPCGRAVKGEDSCGSWC